jgi:hypothetical protein
VIRVTFADGATEDREDDTTCRPDPHSDFESAIHLYRGSRVEVKRGDIWDDCHVETFEEQIARLMAERDGERARADKLARHARALAQVARITLKGHGYYGFRIARYGEADALRARARRHGEKDGESK